MKLSLIFSTLAIVSSGHALADVEVTMTEVRKLGLLPQDKADYRPEDKMDIKRYNPFAEKAKKIEAKTNEDQGETEDSRIRAYLHSQKVTGIVKLGDKYIATVGPLILEAGQTLQPIIPGQTQILRVMRVDKTSVEIGWVEGTPYDTAAPRKIVKKVDLTPRVEVQLVSADSETKDGGKNTYLVDDNGKLYVPPKVDIMPDPSEIAENLPPGSDTNPDSALNADEQAQMNQLENAGSSPIPFLPGSGEPALEDTERAGEGGTLHKPEQADPAGTSSGDAQPPAPPMPTEDEIQADPDLNTPPAAPEQGTKPAGAP